MSTLGGIWLSAVYSPPGRGSNLHTQACILILFQIGQCNRRPRVRTWASCGVTGRRHGPLGVFAAETVFVEHLNAGRVCSALSKGQSAEDEVRWGRRLQYREDVVRPFTPRGVGAPFLGFLPKSEGEDFPWLLRYGECWWCGLSPLHGLLRCGRNPLRAPR